MCQPLKLASKSGLSLLRETVGVRLQYLWTIRQYCSYEEFKRREYEPCGACVHI